MSPSSQVEISPSNGGGSSGTALVTGASGGIGREIARRLAARGHDLVLVSRGREALSVLAEELRGKHGIAVDVLPIDLSTAAGGAAVMDWLTESSRVVEVLVNNAGVGLFGEHCSLDQDAVQRMLILNVLSVSTLCHGIGASMRARKRGQILNIASAAAYQPDPYLAAYGASKSFVLNFSEALAKELEDHGVTITCVSPGPTDTSFFADMDRDGVDNKEFTRSGRKSAAAVADIALAALDAKRLSRMVGMSYAFRAWSTRFAPRSVVASLSKGLLRPHAKG